MLNVLLIFFHGNLIFFNNSKWSFVSSIAAAANAPEAATAGTPIPGLVLSPQRYNAGNGVICPGNVSFPAAIAGP